MTGEKAYFETLQCEMVVLYFLCLSINEPTLGMRTLRPVLSAGR